MRYDSPQRTNPANRSCTAAIVSRVAYHSNYATAKTLLPGQRQEIVFKTVKSTARYKAVNNLAGRGEQGLKNLKNAGRICAPQQPYCRRAIKRATYNLAGREEKRTGRTLLDSIRGRHPSKVQAQTHWQGEEFGVLVTRKLKMWYTQPNCRSAIKHVKK